MRLSDLLNRHYAEN